MSSLSFLQSKYKKKLNESTFHSSMKLSAKLGLKRSVNHGKYAHLETHPQIKKSSKIKKSGKVTVEVEELNNVKQRDGSAAAWQI